MRLPRALLRHEYGATAAEFALVLPVALLFFFGIIDVGRYVWAMQRYEKAVQTGTRYAVATAIVPSGLNSADYIDFDCGGTSNLVAGDTICKDALGTISCSKPGASLACTCTESALGTGSCPDLGTPNATAFANIVQRMRVVAPSLNESNVTVKYSGSGIGYAGDPATDDDDNDLSDIAPIVTVEISRMQFRPTLIFGGGVNLPNFNYSQTLEDGDGAIAY